MPSPEVPSLIDAFDAFLFDIDGVVWLEGVAIPGARETLARLRRRGKRIVFLTNKSTVSREALRERLNDAGLDVRPGEIISSPYATAVYLRERWGSCRVFAIGSAGVHDELERQGHTLVERDPGVVVAGFTPTGDLTPSLLRKIRDFLARGATLVACNKDRGNPLPDGSVSLGSFYTVGVIERATGTTALVIGKPHAPMFEMTFRECGLRPAQCLMVGDIIESDVVGGHNAGTKTLLVLSGIADEVALRESPAQPDFVLASIGDLR
jgi:HAD superfamily hydrolase (TIGR01450 family)